MKIIKLPTGNCEGHKLVRSHYSSLNAGDKVLLTGTVYTARDKAHKLLIQMMNEGKDLPFTLNNSTIYYTGPILDRDTGSFVSAGPTTSSRMDSYTLPLLKNGVAGFIGKGSRSKEVQEYLKRFRAVYFSTVGGAGVYLAEKIRSAKVIAFPELLTEAVYELYLEDFPCYVAIDSKGNSLYDRAEQA